MVAITDRVTIEARFEGQNLRQGTAQATRDMKRFEDSVEKVEKENKRLRIELDRVQKEMKQTGAAAKGVGKDMDGMGKAGAMLKRGLAALAVYMSASKLREYGDEWTNLRNRVKIFTEDQQETEEVVQSLFQISQKTGQAVATTAEVYQRFAMANKELKLSQEDLGKVLTTINQTVALSGVSSQAASAALVQLGQGMSAGVLRGEELNSVIEQTPRLALAIAEGMGRTHGELKKMGEAGAITAQNVVAAIFKEAERVDREFEKLTPTIDRSLTILNNSFGQFIDKLEQQYRVFERLANKISELGLAMGAEEGGGAFKKFAQESAATGAELVGDVILEFGKEVFNNLGLWGAHYTEHSMRNIAKIVGEFDAELGRTMQSMTTKFVWGTTAPFGLAATTGAATAPPTPAPAAGEKPGLGPPAGLTKQELADNETIRLKIAVMEAATDKAKLLAEQELELHEAREKGANAIAGIERLHKVQIDLLEAETKKATEAADAAAKEEAARISAQLGTELLNKEFALMAVTEMEVLENAQRLERVRYKSLDADEDQLAQLKKLHAAERTRLSDLQEETRRTELAAQADVYAAEIEEDKQRQADLTTQAVSELGRVLDDNLNPAIGASIDLIQAIGSGDTASMINFAASALDAFFEILEDGAKMAEMEQDVEMRTRERELQYWAARNRVIESVTGRSPAEDLLQPWQDAFDALGKYIPHIGSRFQAFISSFSGRSLNSLNEIIGNFETIDDIDFLPIDFLEQFSTVQQLQENIYQLSKVFGPSASLIDVAASIVEFDDELTELEKSVNDVGRAAKMTAEELAPLTRSLRMGLDVEEMALRATAQEGMILAGADPYKQNEVFRALSRSIDALRQREVAGIRALKGTTGGGGGTGGGGTGGGDGGGGGGGGGTPINLQTINLERWDDAVNVQDAIPIDRNWNQVVPLIGEGTGHKRIDPEKWWKVVELKTMDTKEGRITKTWNEIVPMIGDVPGVKEKRIDPLTWDRVVELNTMDTRAGRIDRDWNQIVPMIGDVPGVAEKRINPQTWGKVIELEKGLETDAAKIKRNWSQLVTLETSPVSDFYVAGKRISNWSQIVLLAREGGLGKHGRPWSDAIGFYPEGGTTEQFEQYLDMSKVGDGDEGGWSSIVKIPEGLSRHGRPWSHAIKFYPEGSTTSEFEKYLDMAKVENLSGDDAGWSSIVQIPESLGKHGRPWSDAIEFYPIGLTKAGFKQYMDDTKLKAVGASSERWSGVVLIPDDLGKHSRAWSDAIGFYPEGTTRPEFKSYLDEKKVAAVDGDVEGWSSVVQFPDDLGKHGRAWSDAVKFYPEGLSRNEWQKYLDKEKVAEVRGDDAGWSSVVLMPGAHYDNFLGKHSRSWSDAVSFRPGRFQDMATGQHEGWWKVIDFTSFADAAGSWASIPLDAASIFHIDNRIKLSIGDIVDTSELETYIVSTVNRAFSDRATNFSRNNGANTSSGTNTTRSPMGKAHG